MTLVAEFRFDDKDQLGVEFNLKFSSRQFLVFKDISLDCSLGKEGFVCYRNFWRTSNFETFCFPH